MLKDIAPKGKTKSVRSARRLRRAMTLPEVLLWQVLRERPAEFKFRRQHPSGVYLLDFFGSDARLGIEIEGETHSAGDRPERDANRDTWFRGADIQTLRIPAADVLTDLDAVVRGVVAIALARLPLHHPAAPDGPPPRDKLGKDL